MKTEMPRGVKRSKSSQALGGPAPMQDAPPLPPPSGRPRSDSLPDPIVRTPSAGTSMGPQGRAPRRTGETSGTGAPAETSATEAELAAEKKAAIRAEKKLDRALSSMGVFKNAVASHSRNLQKKKSLPSLVATPLAVATIGTRALLHGGPKRAFVKPEKADHTASTADYVLSPALLKVKAEREQLAKSKAFLESPMAAEAYPGPLPVVPKGSVEIAREKREKKAGVTAASPDAPGPEPESASPERPA